MFYIRAYHLKVYLFILGETYSLVPTLNKPKAPTDFLTISIGEAIFKGSIAHNRLCYEYLPIIYYYLFHKLLKHKSLKRITV